MSLGSVFKDFVKNISREYGRDDTFLNAVCASAALVANADGDIAQTEHDAAINLVRNHATLSQLYNVDQIVKAVEHCLGQSKTMTGKMELARYIDAVKNKGDQDMSNDVYAVACDIAMADGKLEDTEKEAMAKIAKRLGVDLSKFDI